ncbi:MAG: OmpP1/FadL family transporter [bacterium]
MSIEACKLTTIVFLTVILCHIFSSYSLADPYHYVNILISERASGLGGTYTAIADDPSGLYYNPAGVVYAAGTKLSASMNTFYKEQKHYDSVLGNNGWDRTCSALLPNFFGFTQPLLQGIIGISYAVTDALIEDQDQSFAGLTMNLMSSIDPNSKVLSDCIINYNNEDHIYNFGPSYAWKISKSFSIGTTLYIHHRKSQWILNQLFNFEEGDDRYLQQNTYYQIKEWGLKPKVGCMWSPDKMKISFGLTLSRTFILDSEEMQQLSTYGSDNIETWMPKEIRDPNNPQYYPYSTSILSTGEKRKYSSVITLGAAYFPNHFFLVTGDMSYYTKIDDSVISRRKRSLVNFSLGAEYYFTTSIAMRVGAFTDFANTYDLDKSKQNQSEHIDIYGGSFSLSYLTRGSTITLGIVYRYGSGEAQVQGGYNVQNVETSSLMGYMGSSYSF